MQGREASALAVEDGIKVLVVEDDEDVRLMLSTFLASKGYAVNSAGTAAEGVSVADETCPALIIMDLGLPDDDGLSAARSIRSNVGCSSITIIILTGYDTLQFRTEAVEAGCVGYMVKPIDPEQLLETVRLLTGPGETEGVRDEGSGSGRLRRYPRASADVT